MFSFLIFIGVVCFWFSNQKSAQPLSKSRSNKEIKILIADFDGPEDYKVTQTVLARMRQAIEKKIDGVKVEALGRKITEQEGPQRAQEEGHKAEANLVLWGYFNTFYRGIIHIEPIKTPPQLRLRKNEVDLNPPAAKRQQIEVEELLSGELNYLVLVVTGLARFGAANYEEAIRCYDEALSLTGVSGQLIDPLDIYQHRGEAWLYKGGADSIVGHEPEDNTKEQSRILIGTDVFTPEISALDSAIDDFTLVIKANPNALNAYYNRALANAKKRDYAKSISDYEKILAIKSDEAHAYLSRGIMYNLIGNYDKAIDDYNMAENLTQRKEADVYYNRAIAYYEKGEWQQALMDYQAALVIEPNQTDALINQAIIYGRQGDSTTAINQLNKAIEFDPTADTYLHRGRAWGQIGMFKQELADYNTAIALDPSSPAGYHYRGHFFDSRGRINESIQDFSTILRLDPKASYAYHDRASAWIQKKDDQQAIIDLTAAIELNPSHNPNWFNRGLAYDRLKQYDQAIADLTQALKLNTDTNIEPIYYIARGMAYLDKGDYRLAIADLTSGIEERPRYMNARLKRASAYIKIGKLDFAINDYREGLAEEVNTLDESERKARRNIYNESITELSQLILTNPRNGSAYFARGIAHTLAENYDAALNDLNFALDLKLASPEIYEARGQLLMKFEKYNAALESYDHAIKLDPKFISAYFYRGIVHRRNGQLLNAITDFSQCINLNPNDIKARLFRGTCYAELGKFRYAITDFNAILTLYPNYDEALINRGLVFADMGNRQLAIADLRKCLENSDIPEIQQKARAQLSLLGQYGLAAPIE